MSLLHGRSLGARLLTALGLDGQLVTRITIHVAVNDAVRAEVTRLVADGTEVETEQLMTSAQGELLVRELTVSGPRWRLADGMESRTEEIVAGGDAERLAEAVLAGDWRAALPLADLVQESWAAEQQAKENE